MVLAGRFLLVCAAMVGVAGCGVDQVQPSSPTAVASPTPVPTLSITGGSVAASVNGKPIAMQLFRAFANYSYKNAQASSSPITPAEAGKEAIGQLIEFEVALQQAKRLGLSPSEHTVTKQIVAQEKANGGKAKFESQLKQSGLSDASYRFLVTANLADGKIASKQFPIRTSGLVAQAKQFLVAAKKPLSLAEALFTQSIKSSADRCTGRVLSYAQAKARATKYLAQLRGGKSFSKLTKRCSDDAYSAPTGGWLTGPLNTHVLYPFAEGFAPNIEKTIFSEKTGTYRLLGSIDGWHIIQVTGRSKVKYSTKVNSTLGRSIPSQIQEYELQSWLNTQSQLAYKHTTIFEHVSK